MERTLSEFLRNGRLGGLKFGASKADVRRLLGGPPPARRSLASGLRSRIDGAGGADVPPARRSLANGLRDRTSGGGGVWTRGALRVAFDGGRVTTLALVFREPLPTRLRLAGWWPSRATTFRELIDYLRSEAIPYRMAIPSDAQIALQAGRAGVRFALEGTATSLESIRVTNS